MCVCSCIPPSSGDLLSTAQLHLRQRWKSVTCEPRCLQASHDGPDAIWSLRVRLRLFLLPMRLHALIPCKRSGTDSQMKCELSWYCRMSVSG